MFVFQLSSTDFLAGTV